MKTSEINNELVGKRVKGVFTGMEVTGIIANIVDNKYSLGVEIVLDTPVNWGGDLYKKYQSTARRCDEFGNLKYTELI